MTAALPDVGPPDPHYIKQRWPSPREIDWVKGCDRIMLEYGKVQSVDRYEKRHVARRRAQKLIRQMVQLGLHEHWELGEHTYRTRDGWSWSVEYYGRNHGSKSTAA